MLSVPVKNPGEAWFIGEDLIYEQMSKELWVSQMWFPKSMPADIVAAFGEVFDTYANNLSFDGTISCKSILYGGYDDYEDIDGDNYLDYPWGR